MKHMSISPQGQSVVLIDDEDVEIGVMRGGARADGQACQLTIAVNGRDAVSFLEDAGPAAPLRATIDLDMPAESGKIVLDAMRTRPWQYADCPVIPYAVAAAPAGDADNPIRSVAYLVNNRPIGDVIDVIRETLDLATPE